MFMDLWILSFSVDVG